MKTAGYIGCFCIFFFTACYSQVHIQKISTLSSDLNETSGLACENSNSFWTLNDGGNGNYIFNIDSTGHIICKYPVISTKNKDWESLCLYKDTLYIADVGNNLNKRTKFQIYKVALTDLKTAGAQAKTITFNYQEQIRFPAPDSSKYYDCEAIVVDNGSIYLVSKNRTNPYDGKIIIYKLPDKNGQQTAVRYYSFKTQGKNKFLWWVTGACLNNSDLVLLSHNKLFIISNFLTDPTLGVSVIDLNDFSQKEGICHLKNGICYISSEKLKFLSPKFYKLQLDN